MPKGSLPEQPINPSPNLLENVVGPDESNASETFREAVKRTQNSLFVKIPIIVIQIVLLVVIGITSTLNALLEQKTLSISNYVRKINSYGDINNKVDELTKRVALYRKLKAQQPQISDKYLFLIDSVSPEAEVKGISYNKGKISMTVEAETPLNLALLMSKYFNNKSIREIIITSATYSQRENVFTVAFEIGYKDDKSN